MYSCAYFDGRDMTLTQPQRPQLHQYVLASKLGADSGLTVYIEETSSKLSNHATGNIGI